MKKLIFLFLLIPIIGLAQEGGFRSLKTISGKVYLSDQTGSQNRILIVQPNGHISSIDNGIDGQFLKTNGAGAYSFSTLPIASATVTGTVKVDGTTIVSTDGVISVSTAGTGWNHTYQPLSGTTITYDASAGINATLTLSGNTTINMSNVQTGMIGNMTIINDGTARQISFTGYTFKISLKIRGGSNMAWSSATGFDKFTWDYDGTRLTITGEYNVQ